MGFWWGLALFGVAAAPAWWWSAVGAVSITMLFRFVSLPLIETRMLERRPDYAAYSERTSRFIPWPPRHTEQ
jgi:steroid 5-alpha reductase family enzyme